MLPLGCSGTTALEAISSSYSFFEIPSIATENLYSLPKWRQKHWDTTTFFKFPLTTVHSFSI